MGQKKIKTIDLSQEAVKKPDKAKKEKKTDKDVKSVIKSGKDQGRLSDMGEKALKEAEAIEKKKSKEEKEIIKSAKKKAVQKIRSKRYNLLKAKINKSKLYSFKDSIALLLNFPKSKIDETVEVHINTLKSKLSGSVSLPYGTGKSQKIAIADDQLIANVEKGKVDFDVLISTPEMMPKIAKVAKILGPKGLMPNPKTGTITDKPEQLKKKLEAGETRFKTEAKAAVIHFTIGKVSFGEKKLWENLEAFIKAIDPKLIKKAVLCSTHSPGIRLMV